MYLNCFVFSDLAGAFGKPLPASRPIANNKRSKSREFPPVRLSETGKADRLSRRIAYPNCDIPAGRPDSESPRSLLARARKAKIHLERKLFSQLFCLSSIFLMKFGELSDFFRFLLAVEVCFLVFGAFWQRL